jgi:hypothetical protein
MNETIVVSLIFILLIAVFAILTKTFAIHRENAIVRKRLGNTFVEWLKEEHSKEAITDQEIIVENIANKFKSTFKNIKESIWQSV